MGVVRAHRFVGVDASGVTGTEGAEAGPSSFTAAMVKE
jgi:hypothetical protein